MKIGAIIEKHYNTLEGLVKLSETPVYGSMSTEDIFQNCILTALKKYGNRDITEEEGLEYLKKTILTETHFAYRRKKNEKLLFVENLIIYDVSPE